MTWFLSKFHNQINFTDNTGVNKIHDKPRATGSGAILIILFLIYFIFFIEPTSQNNTYITSNITKLWFLKYSILTLLILSFFDFIYGIESRIRLCIQLSIGYFSLSCIPILTSTNTYLNFLNFLPVKLIELIIIFSWVYIINITNFIDGVDGSSGIQMLTTFIGYLILNFSYLNIEVISLICIFIIIHSLIILMAPIYFKTFLSDMGSIPLGFISGWLFIWFFLEGFILEVFLINIVYFSDVIYTHLKKLFILKESIFTRHRDFLYQKFYFKKNNKWTFLFIYFNINIIPILILYLII